MKDSLNQIWRLVAKGFCLFALFAAVSALAQIKPMTPPPAAANSGDSAEEENPESLIEPWEVRKKEMEKFQKATLDAKRNEVKEIITEYKTVEFIKSQIRRRINTPIMGDFRILRIPGIEIDWSNYNQDPPKSKETIVDDIRNEAIDHAYEKIRPDERAQAILDTADERFRMVQINERVTLQLRQGRGAAAFIDNQPLRGINDERVQLGSRFIIREDLDEADQALFYPDVNARVKEAYITNSLGKIEVEMESMIAQECYERTASGFLENNYIPDITKPNASLRTAKPEYWVPKSSFVRRIRNILIDIQIDAYEKSKEFEEIMNQQGYYYVPTEDKRGMEWVDTIEMAERKAKEVASQVMNPEDGTMGPPGMGPEPGMPPSGMPPGGMAPSPTRR